ncbi:MAG TPA: hypothetical protein VFN49_13720 [Candidatus Aquilonibacter sp.]|nr:hypothetical protein [Candidatus Aquilonibacter sp.]
MRTRSLLLLTALLAVACSSAPTPQERAEQTERDAMAPLKQRYPDVVMGFDFHGTSADVSVDLNQEIQMDDDKEDAMRNQAVAMWRSAWMKANPGKHATLTLRILDFRGNVNWKKTTKA